METNRKTTNINQLDLKMAEETRDERSCDDHTNATYEQTSAFHSIQDTRTAADEIETLVQKIYTMDVSPQTNDLDDHRCLSNSSAFIKIASLLLLLNSEQYFF